MNYKLYSKIALVFVASFFVARTASNTIFLSSTPRINKPFLEKAYAFGYRVPGISNIMLSFYTNPEEQLKKLPLQNIAKGVYAKDKENVSYREYKLDELELIEYRFIIDGKEIKINVPKGELPPPIEMVENIK